ncbi:MAG: DUF3040 domain-containing protein [Streptosporangiaceae bacterium]|nr:DUF3040 domain-containing protein [Streptosporangiaceae bacterium]
MALSMDEQRVLAEIERRLAAEDPGLAASLANFRRPGPAAVLRSPRARIIGSLFTVLLVATVSLMVYAMIPFRAHGVRVPASRSSVTAPSQTHISAAGSGSPGKSSTVASAPASLRKTGTAATARTSGSRQASTRSSSSTGAAARGSATSKSTTTASASSSPPQVRAKAAGNR